jgi:very-short-patch-repair endonuclease
LPEPDVNYVVVNTETGRDIRLDLALRSYKLVIEYQGDYHRSKDQWRKDMTRRTRLEAQGWRVMELNADDLRDPVELVARIQRTLALSR